MENPKRIKEKTMTFEWEVWKTIELGSFGNSNILRIATLDLAENTIRLIEGNAIPLSSEKKQIDLALVTMDELGFDSITRMSTVLKRAKSMGLDIVPPEVPLQLLLQLGSKEETLKELRPIKTINFAMDLVMQGNQGYLLGIMHNSESDPQSTLCAWSRSADSGLGCYESIVFKV